MRILLVTHSYPRYTGDVAGAFVLRLAQGLATEGDDVRVLAPAGEGLAPRDTVGAVPVRRFRYAPRTWETLAYGGTMAEQVAGSWRGKAALAGLIACGAAALRGEASSFSPDIVHAHWWFPSGVMATVAHLGVPLVTTMHGSDVRLARTKSLATPLLRLVIARSSAVTAVSTWLALEAKAMAPGLDALVEPMPVDAALFSPGGAHESRRFVFVGRLNEQKGVGILLEALASSATGASLDIVGGGDRTAVDALVARLDLGTRVTVHGPLSQEQVVPIYQAATATIVPSENEGLGLVAVESMLCETPVIAFRSGGLTDVVIDGETGVLTPPGDAAALASAMDAMVRDARRAAALGRAGRLFALARFARDRVAGRYRSIYRQALEDAAR